MKNPPNPRRASSLVESIWFVGLEPCPSRRFRERKVVVTDVLDATELHKKHSISEARAEARRGSSICRRQGRSCSPLARL